ncbi:MAG: PilN domain-containing protein [Legionella sp.]|nr:PilN domain-containing protein [Legionella sp.]
MTEINLLPWRELRREREKSTFRIILGSAVIFAVVLLSAMHFYLSGLITGQAQRNQRLQTEITQFDGQIAKINALKHESDLLISRMALVNDMQVKRIITVHLFDELVTVLPDTAYLTLIKRAGDKVMLQGYCASNKDVYLLMRNIQKNPWIKEPVLTEIKKTADKTAIASYEFNLNFIIKPKNTTP